MLNKAKKILNMSNLKREFVIQINGITQSVDAVKTLKSELKDCEDIRMPILMSR